MLYIMCDQVSIFSCVVLYIMCDQVSIFSCVVLYIICDLHSVSSFLLVDTSSFYLLYFDGGKIDTSR